MVHLLIPPALGIVLWALQKRGWLSVRLAVSVCAGAIAAMVFVEGGRIGLTALDSLAAAVLAALAVALLVGGWLLAMNRLRGRASKHYVRW